MTVWWNVVQACVWIATEDEQQVSRVRTSETLYSTDSTISDRSLSGASMSVSADAVRDGRKLRQPVKEARTSLASACAAGELRMVGRLFGKGDPAEIPALAWANLEIRDHEQYGIVAASPDMFDHTASWWDELRVPRSAAQSVWSPSVLMQLTYLPSPSPSALERQAHRAEQVNVDPGCPSQCSLEPPTPISEEINPTSADKSGKSPTYPAPPVYKPDRVPAEFTDWAKEQNDSKVKITASLAENAMRGPKDSTGRRHGGLLMQGTGLARDTIRIWVDTLDPTWVAKRGEPPSRSSKM